MTEQQLGRLEKVDLRNIWITAAEVSLAWLAAQLAVTSVILGARNPRQLAENLKAAALDLTVEEIAKLTAVSAPTISDYPYGKAGAAQRHRKIA